MPSDFLRGHQKQLKQEIVPDEEVKNHRKKINLLENKLKNICIRQIVKIREERNKQTIKEAVDAILKVNRVAKDKRSKKVEKYVKRTFEQAAAENMSESTDILYNRVIVNMKRLLKVLTGHSSAIDSLERKLRDISAPKKKKHAMMQALKKLEHATRSNFSDDGHQDLNQLIEEELDDGGIQGYQEDENQPEYMDEIDIMSEGQMEREIMMDQIRMVEID